MMAVLAFALSYAGFAALALAMERHFAQAFGARRAPGAARVSLRLAGAGFLLASCAASLRAWGAGPGMVGWPGLLTLAALLLVLGLMLRPRMAAAAAVPLLAAGLLAA